MTEYRCRGLLFDLDGVLVDSRPVIERTWRRWSARHGLDADAILRVAHGRRTRDTLKDVAPHLAADDEVAWLDAAELEDVDGLRAVPGAAALLAALPRARWAIVTSCGRTLAELRLRAVELPVPNVLVTSEQVHHGKPAPDGYQRAAQLLGHSSRECLVFEDAPAGVAAGRAADACVIGLTTTHAAEDLMSAHAVISDFTELTLRVAPEEVVVGLAQHCSARSGTRSDFY